MEQVEPIFMSSRDGITFDRWNEPVIPQTAPEDRDGNRSNYMTNGLVVLPENDREYAVYATEAYYSGPDSRVRRFTYRLDGFVSLHAGDEGGTMVTKPLIYSGDHLSLNFKTSEGGTNAMYIARGRVFYPPGHSLGDLWQLCRRTHTCQQDVSTGVLLAHSGV